MTTGERAAPFHCPYCGDEGLRPFDPDDGSTGHGQWRCESCRRVFALRYLGLSSPGGTAEQQSGPAQRSEPAHRPGQRQHPPRPGSSPP